GPPPAALVDTLFLGDGDTCLLPLTAILQFDLSKPQQDRGDHATDRTVEFDLLRDDHDLEATLAPIGQQVDAVLEAAAQAVEFPDDDRPDRAVENVPLESLETWPVQCLARLRVPLPMDLIRADSVA